MKTILFACDQVGYEIAKFLSSINKTPLYLVLDEKDRNSFNNKIVSVLKLKKENIFQYKDFNPKSFDEKDRPDIGILAWWPYIVKSDIINFPIKGTINLHPSYLPYNKGKDPNFWALKDNTPFGISLHFVNENIDSGEIISRKEIHYTWEDTGESLYNKAKTEIVELFKNTYPDIEKNNINPVVQDKKLSKINFRKNLEKASEIKLNKKYLAKDLLNLMRARTFKPYPGAWFYDEDGTKYEVRIEIKKVKHGRDS